MFVRTRGRGEVLLSDERVDVNARDDDDGTSLADASASGFHEIVCMLLAKKGISEFERLGRRNRVRLRDTRGTREVRGIVESSWREGRRVVMMMMMMMTLLK